VVHYSQGRAVWSVVETVALVVRSGLCAQIGEMMDHLATALLYSSLINYGLLLLWVGLVLFAREPFHRLQSRLFKVSIETCNTVNYAGIALYKIGILLFQLVPWLALTLAR
jgi:hypothetical protein